MEWNGQMRSFGTVNPNHPNRKDANVRQTGVKKWRSALGEGKTPETGMKIETLKESIIAKKRVSRTCADYEGFMIGDHFGV
jgi:hypothetical protein